MAAMSPFRPFGPDHLGVLFLTLGIGLALVLFAPRIRRFQDDRIARYTWATVLILDGFFSWILLSYTLGLMALPLQLCDLALFLTAWALVGKNPYVAELAFFWGLGGSLQAVLTPDLTEGFPSLSWMTFFLGHSGVVLGAVYLLVRGRVSLTRYSVWRVFLISNFYLGVVGIVNWQLGTNFAYLARKPEQPSLLDYLGPWPSYIFWGEGIGLALFFLCYAFGRWVNRWAESHERLTL